MGRETHGTGHFGGEPGHIVNGSDRIKSFTLAEVNHLVQTAVEPVAGLEIIWYLGPRFGLSHCRI
jgi:hypothetical protein